MHLLVISKYSRAVKTWELCAVQATVTYLQHTKHTACQLPHISHTFPWRAEPACPTPFSCLSLYIIIIPHKNYKESTTSKIMLFFCSSRENTSSFSWSELHWGSSLWNERSSKTLAITSDPIQSNDHYVKFCEKLPRSAASFRGEAQGTTQSQSTSFLDLVKVCIIQH